MNKILCKIFGHNHHSNGKPIPIDSGNVALCNSHTNNFKICMFVTKCLRCKKEFGDKDY